MASVATDNQTITTISCGNSTQKFGNTNQFSRVKTYNQNLLLRLQGIKSAKTSEEEEEEDEIEDEMYSKLNEIDNDIISRNSSTGSKSFSSKSQKEKIMEAQKELRVQRFQQLQEKILRQQEENQREVREAMEERRRRKEAEYAKNMRFIDEGRKFAGECARKIQLHENNLHVKQCKIYDEWNDTVYGEIQRGIEKQVKNLNYYELNKRKCEAYEQFLDQTNRKPCIFRDIIIESEYDPLELNRQCIKHKTGYVVDPPKRSTQRTEEENNVLPGSTGKEPKSICKYTFETPLWHTGKVEDTPHGFFAKMMNKGPKQPHPIAKKLQASRIVFDHYNVPTGKEIMKSEVPVGKQCVPVEDHIVFDDQNKDVEVRKEGVKIFPDQSGSSVELG